MASYGTDTTIAILCGELRANSLAADLQVRLPGRDYSRRSFWIALRHCAPPCSPGKNHALTKV